MEPETIINLFDSYWFYLDFFNNNIKQPSNQILIPEIPSSNPEIPSLPTIHTKLKSPVDKISSIFSPRKMSDYTASPNSVLQSPKLQTIFSGKVSDEYEEPKEITSTKPECSNKNQCFESRRNKKKKGFSKSLSDLEFEEVKGFIDLGFVFSQEDCDTDLVSIIPGLQRLGIKSSTNKDNINIINNNSFDYDTVNNNWRNDDSNVVNNTKTYVEQVNDKKKENLVVKSAAAISRPYLSESWDVLEKKRREDYLTNWRIPTPNNQDQMKDNLRFWAHAVASTVR